MTTRAQSPFLLRNRNARRDRTLRKMAAMRAAKARKRLANPIEREPRMQRWFPLQLGIRDKVSGETAWTDLRSIRDAVRRISVVLLNYAPGRNGVPIQ
jgi:cobalamin biosynthesis Mg chelatase CobN